MDRITILQKNVKNTSLKDLEKLIYNSRIYKYNPKKRVHTWVQFHNHYYLPLFEEDINQGNSCLFDVPMEYRKEDNSKPKKKRRNRAEFFSRMHGYDTATYIPDKILLHIQDKQLSSAPVISVFQNLYKTITYKAKVKGSKVYNKQLADSALSDAKEFSSTHTWIYFLTSTCDPSLYGGSRQLAFKNHIKERGRITKALKRKYGVQVQYFTEVTNNGWPHTHFVIYSTRPLCQEKERPTAPQSVRRGQLYEFCKKRLAAPIFDLKKATSEKIAGYLVKYIAKTTILDEEKKSKDGVHLTKKHRKEIMTNFFPCVYGYRAYGSTFRKTTQKPAEKTASAGNTFSETKSERKELLKQYLQLRKQENPSEGDIFDLLEKAARRADNLIAFRIKENIPCSLKVQFLSHRQGVIIDKACMGKQLAKNRPFLGRKDIKIINKGCTGCHFHDFIMQNAEEIQKGTFHPTDFPWFTVGEFIQDYTSWENLENEHWKQRAKEQFILTKRRANEKDISTLAKLLEKKYNSTRIRTKEVKEMH